MEDKSIKVIKILTFIILFAVAVLLTQFNFRSEVKYSSIKEDTSSPSKLGKYSLNEGSIPPDFTITTAEGSEVTLSDFAKQKKPILVYFMATWCPYCAEDYAELSKVYPEYKNKIVILSISLDTSENADLIREYKKKYPKLYGTMFAAGKNSILVDYRVTKTTAKYGISKDGKIVYAGFGTLSEDEWRNLLEAIINA